MSDDKQGSDEQQKEEESTSAKEATAKTYSEDEFKKVIAERQEAKEKARKYEEEKQKAEEEKAIADGKLADVLATTKEENKALKAFKEAREEEDRAMREELIGKLSDDDKEIATDIANLSKLRKFVDKQTQAQSLNQGKGGKVDTSKDHLTPKPGESVFEYNNRIMREQQSKH